MATFLEELQPAAQVPFLQELQPVELPQLPPARQDVGAYLWGQAAEIAGAGARSLQERQRLGTKAATAFERML